MARFLLEPDSGIPERLLELIDELPAGRTYFYPFKDEKFRQFFAGAVSRHRHRISTFYQRYAKLRKSFRVYLQREKQPPWWSAEACENHITFFRRFFSKPRWDRYIFLQHEMAHVIQYLIERRLPGPKSASADTEEETSSYAPRSYYNSPDEIETWTMDFFEEIRYKRRKGLLRTESQVVRWLNRNKYFPNFYKHNQRRMVRKILWNLKKYS
jgi:hypothetical protein